MPTPKDYSRYLVTDRPSCLGRYLPDIVAEAVRGGVSMVQLREKTLDTRAFVELARTLKALLAGTDIPLLINDRLDVALAVDADGVHIGQDDMDPATARRLIGPDRILGLSVSSITEARQAFALPAATLDYFGVGPIFPTQTKPDAKPPLGLGGLAELRAATELPLVAIGGIGPDTTAEVIAAGADGVAVVSAICSADEPGRTASAMARTIDLARKDRS